MPTPAKTLVDDLVKQRDAQRKNKKAPDPHRDSIALLQADAQIALARSNVELVEAVQALTEAANKNNGALKDAVQALTAKVAELGKR
ncbi:hypothetical protein [Streptomyces sp. NA02536]|uniref:hypothetical protein n=1 Tax=Streptomyces sp. NA02536 TaxID=2742133 RepID=UPI001591F3B7|nr:hypothetical protein [Streptomyces sp. NA02536]QKW00630.1 hypothetical protein HUT14_12490 [Streptomyces sp. NA02536]